jgi:hypothetical protein
MREPGKVCEELIVRLVSAFRARLNFSNQGNLLQVIPGFVAQGLPDHFERGAAHDFTPSRVECGAACR